MPGHARLIESPEPLLFTHLRPLLLSLVLAALTLCAPGQASAQDLPREHAGAAWAGLMTDWQLKGPWSLWFDTHYNTRAFIVFRGGVTYAFKSGPKITAGYAHLFTDPGDDSFDRNEHRPWAQVFLPMRFSDYWSASQRFRFDLRVQQSIAGGQVQEGWLVTPRWRSQTAATWHLDPHKTGRWFLQPAIEILVNGGPNAGPNFLDQNRISLMVGHRQGPITIRVGYMDRFVPGKQGTSPLHEHNGVLWLNYVFRRKDAKTTPVSSPEMGNP